MRIATYNVNSITARLPRLLAWLESSGTDVLCIQETKRTAEQFPAEALREAGYESAVNATGRWNGVALLLPRRPRRRRHRAARRPGVRRRAGAPRDLGDLRPAAPLVGVRAQRPRGRARALRVQAALAGGPAWKAVAADAAGSLPFAVLGDFNVAPTDEDVWDPALFEGATHVTPRRARRTRGPGGGGSERGPPPALKYDRAYTFLGLPRAAVPPKTRACGSDLTFGNAPFTAAVRTVTSTARSARAGRVRPRSRGRRPRPLSRACDNPR